MSDKIYVRRADSHETDRVGSTIVSSRNAKLLMFSGENQTNEAGEWTADILSGRFNPRIPAPSTGYFDASALFPKVAFPPFPISQFAGGPFVLDFVQLPQVSASIATKQPIPLPVFVSLSVQQLGVELYGEPYEGDQFHIWDIDGVYLQVSDRNPLFPVRITVRSYDSEGQPIGYIPFNWQLLGEMRWLAKYPA